jgi:hypothetical protein
MKREFRECDWRLPCYFVPVSLLLRNCSLLFFAREIAKTRMNAALLDDAAVFLATIIWFSLYFSLLWQNSFVRPVRLRLRPPPLKN